MSKNIQKLNKLENPESFIQLNTVKGFKYVDKAGEIVNEYYTDTNPPKFNMGLDGLVIGNPTPKIDTLKVTPAVIWAKFNEIPSLDMVMNIFVQESTKIIKILEVEQLSRIGWRNYLIYEFASDDKFNNYFKNLTSIQMGKLPQVTTEITTNRDFKVNLTIQALVKSDSPNTKAVLFDVDIYKEKIVNTEQIDSVLKNFFQYMKDEKGLLESLNSTFK